MEFKNSMQSTGNLFGEKSRSKDFEYRDRSIEQLESNDPRRYYHFKKLKKETREMHLNAD